MTTPPPSLTRLSKQCGNLEVSQRYGTPLPITNIGYPSTDGYDAVSNSLLFKANET
jgi:hypothetical protein